MTDPINVGARGPESVYQEAVGSGSDGGDRITSQEFDAIMTAFNRNSRTTVAGYKIPLMDDTRANQNNFLRSLADRNPALAQTILRGGSWSDYVGTRTSHQHRPESEAQARTALRAELGGTVGAAQSEPVRLPDSLRARATAMGDRAYRGASEVLSPTDGKFMEYYGQLLEGEYRTEEGRALLAEVGRVRGVSDPRQAIADVIGESRRSR